MSFIKKVIQSFLGAPLFIIVFGLIFFAFGAGLSYQQYDLRQNGLQVQGEVIRLTESCDDEGCSYSPVVKFTTRDGQNVTYNSTFSSNPPSYDIGEIVTIFYREANPHKALIKGEGGLLRIIFTALGVGGIAFGFILFARALRERLMAGD